MGNYEIESLERLEESGANLARYNQLLTDDAQTVKYVMNAISQNWQNEKGQDLQSVMENIKDVLDTIEREIQPVITTYVGIVNDYVARTKVNQNQTIY